ncbi:RNA polymerase sigma factor [Desulfosporosinus sp. BICA1-9]|uniref:RNA polymerase sigma factor n=1 Tax=Desulfosporosinus sp. BICA1-9 TaxID=1531958 RepID=UPI00054C4461|nr:RNA polymerase sigma factor [Desulfosporosinus sp. BICA1-9]KJS87386.1 MAG: RNA polymerase subunit sigma-24 [Desulfosporosinus sp. BICA1-9]HBW35713.1 RNA polymerase sigma factor [Desulfosporosinus sp.]
MKIKENLYTADSSEGDLSFEEIISQNQEKIINLIYGMTGDYYLSQDLTQETFLKAFQSKHSFNGKSKFSTWLYRIAVNVTVDHQRKSCVRKEMAAEQADPKFSKVDTLQDPDRACQKNATRNIIFSSIANLPDQQKEVFVLRELNGCSTKEVSEILDCSVELVKWRLHKARLSMRKTLNNNTNYKNLGTITLNRFGLE